MRVQRVDLLSVGPLSLNTCGLKVHDVPRQDKPSIRFSWPLVAGYVSQVGSAQYSGVGGS